MEHHAPRSPAPAPTGPGVPALPADAATAVARQAVLDAHGYDPADFDWIPVKRKPRADGWSAEKQRLFIATLADTGSVSLAARAVGMSTKSAYALRRAPDGAGFDRAWTAAIRRAMQRLIDVCMERALEGTLEPIYHEGNHVGHRTRHHDRMAMFLLRAHMPELFRDAHRADRARGEALPPPPEPVADALKLLDPVPPDAPHALMEPEQLDVALQCAAIIPGALPTWRRDPGLVAMERAARGEYRTSPLGEEFERELELAKLRPGETIESVQAENDARARAFMSPDEGLPGKRARRRQRGRA